MESVQWHKHNQMLDTLHPYAIEFYKSKLGHEGVKDCQEMIAASTVTARPLDELKALLLTYRLKKTPELFELFMDLSSENKHEARRLIDSCSDADFYGYLKVLKLSQYPKVEIFDIWNSWLEQDTATYNGKYALTPPDRIALNYAANDEEGRSRSVFLTALYLLVSVYGITILEIAEAIIEEKKQISVITLLELAENWESVKGHPIDWSATLHNQDHRAYGFDPRDWFYKK